MISSYAFRTLHQRTAASLSHRRGASSYRSPHLGYSVSWASSWAMRHDDAQDTDPSAEGMMLQHDSGRATVKVVCADRREMLDSAETVRFWTSPFYLTRFMDPGTRIVLSDHNRCSGAVVMVGRDENGEPVVTMKETYSTGYRSAVRVTLTAPLDSFEEAYRQARESLQIDHRPMFRFFGCDVLDVVLA